MNIDDLNKARAFDLNAIDADFINDPFPTLKLLRDHSPVHRNLDGSVYLTRYNDVKAVYQSKVMSSDKKQAFGEKFGKGGLYTHHTTSLIFNDPPYHTIVRKLLSSAFTPRKLAEMEPLIKNIIDNLLDQLEEEQEFDFIEAYASKLPTEIISFMLGIPEQHRSRLRGYSMAILGALDPVISDERMQAGNEAVDEFGALLDDLINHRRNNPDGAGEGEVLESLIFGEFNGKKLTQKELVQNCIFLLNAGHETTTSLVGNALATLLDNPDEFSKLKANPDLIESAIEEVLRFQSPLQIGNRLALEDFELNDTVLPAGTYIHTSIAGANRDPAVFTDPEKFDISRKPNRHLAFIAGIHVCLGATLSRLEGKAAIGQLVQRFPDIQATGTGELNPLARFRGYNKLPVRIGG